MNLQSSNNNPAGSPPVETGPSEADIMDVFGLGDTSSAADQIASGSTPPQSPEGEPPAGAGEAGAAPASSPEPSPAASAATPAAPEPAPAAPSAAQPAPSAAPAPQPAAPQAVDESALRLASQTAQIDALTRELEQFRAQSANPQQGTQPRAAPETGQPAQQTLAAPYALSLPPQVAQALASDDPDVQARGVQAVVNDLATIVHHNVILQTRQEIAQAIAGLVQQGQSSVQQTEAETAREQAKKDYYDAFPGHNNPLVLPIIQSETQKMAAEFPHLPWNADYINALGARVDAAINALRGGSAPQSAEPAPSASSPPARPAPSIPSGPRPEGAATAAGDISAEIMSVLDPFSE